MVEHFISIVLGTYSNRNDILDKYAVQSLMKSEYPKDRFEVVIIDNNANQNIYYNLLKNYQNNSLIKIGREERPGICFVRNKGVELSKGDIICFTDDDCELDTLWLNRMNKFYQDSSIIFGGGSIFDTKLRMFLRKSKYDIEFPEERRIPGGNMSFRKKVFEKFRFDENILYGVDEFDLIFRLLQEGYSWYFDEKPILHYRSASQYRDKNTELNEKGKSLGETATLYYSLKKKMYAKFRHIKNLDWQKIRNREKTIIFLKYYFLSKKKYHLSLDALKKIEDDLNFLLNSDGSQIMA